MTDDYSSLKGMERGPCEEWSTLWSKLHFHKINRVQGDSSSVLGSLCKWNKESVAAQINMNYPQVETPTTCYSQFQPGGVSGDIHTNSTIHFYTVFLIQRSQMALWKVSHPWAKANQMDEGGREASTSGPWEEGRSCQNQRLESCASKDSTSLCCCNKQPPKLASLTVLLSCFHKTQRASGRLLGQLSTFHGTQWSRLYRSYGSYILTEALMSKGSEPWVAIQRGFDAFAWQQPFDQNKAYTLYSQGSWDILENRRACLVNTPLSLPVVINHATESQSRQKGDSSQVAHIIKDVSSTFLKNCFLPLSPTQLCFV